MVFSELGMGHQSILMLLPGFNYTLLGLECLLG